MRGFFFGVCVLFFFGGGLLLLPGAALWVCMYAGACRSQHLAMDPLILLSRV